LKLTKIKDLMIR